ncbi:hypothetical protein CMO91_05045 [Candidatus Woesearchaeota archaeon]|nr:hypothetical protein [Candidatus Woesearchaeota archaeon]|tara:strand:- start:275 stop:658 length:384 start_codon:yes stop_codon:yes gene_type:complete
MAVGAGVLAGPEGIVRDQEGLEDRDAAAEPWWQYFRGGAFMSLAGLAMTPMFPSWGQYIFAAGLSCSVIGLLPFLPYRDLAKIRLARSQCEREEIPVADRHTTPFMMEERESTYLSGLEEEVSDFAA